MIEGRLSAITSAPERKRNLAGRSTSLVCNVLVLPWSFGSDFGWPELASAGHYRINLEAGQTSWSSHALPSIPRYPAT